jgi:hypothetical protein
VRHHVGDGEAEQDRGDYSNAFQGVLR